MATRLVNTVSGGLLYYTGIGCRAGWAGQGRHLRIGPNGGWKGYVETAQWFQHRLAMGRVKTAASRWPA